MSLVLKAPVGLVYAMVQGCQLSDSIWDLLLLAFMHHPV